MSDSLWSFPFKGLTSSLSTLAPLFKLYSKCPHLFFSLWHSMCHTTWSKTNFTARSPSLPCYWLSRGWIWSSLFLSASEMSLFPFLFAHILLHIKTHSDHTSCTRLPSHWFSCIPSSPFLPFCSGFPSVLTKGKLWQCLRHPPSVRHYHSKAVLRILVLFNLISSSIFIPILQMKRQRLKEIK